MRHALVRHNDVKSDLSQNFFAGPDFRIGVRCFGYRRHWLAFPHDFECGTWLQRVCSGDTRSESRDGLGRLGVSRVTGKRCSLRRVGCTTFQYRRRPPVSVRTSQPAVSFVITGDRTIDRRAWRPPRYGHRAMEATAKPSDFQHPARSWLCAEIRHFGNFACVNDINGPPGHEFMPEMHRTPQTIPG